MNEGSVFVSGAFGTLTFGDTNGADEQWVGDVPGDFSLTGLTELDETLFVSNAGDFGTGGGGSFAENPFGRPTVRYDFDIMGFGISASSNRDLTDIAVGTGYAADFGGGSWSIGVGYNTFESFDATVDTQTITVVDVDGNEVEIEGDEIIGTFPDGEQWSVGLNGEYDAFGFGVTYVNLSTDDNPAGESFDADNLLVGASFGWEAWSFGVVYGNILSADGALDELDGDSSWEVSAQYDLGGGASINAGVQQTYDLLILGDEEEGGDSATVADFGIKMAF
jgi:outer membrane protein OmpU